MKREKAMGAIGRSTCPGRYPWSYPVGGTWPVHGNPVLVLEDLGHFAKGQRFQTLEVLYHELLKSVHPLA